MNGNGIEAEREQNIRQTLWIVITDVLVVSLILLTILLIYSNVLPTTQRGYSCNDLSIRLPQQDDIVPWVPLIAIGTTINVIIIFVVEICNSWPKKSNFRFGPWEVPQSSVDIYKYCGLFTLGVVLQHLCVALLKKTVGRLRPHFYHVCEPQNKEGDCTLVKNFFAHIAEFTCSLTKYNQTQVDQARLSFPSGHASAAMFCALFASIFLQYRWKVRRTHFVKPAVQLALVSAGWFAGISRVADNHHHGTDVAAGFVIGILASLLLVMYDKRAVKNERRPCECNVNRNKI